MRRFTLGATILLGGTLFALPFRRPPQPIPADETDSLGQSHGDHFDDDSIRMLVQEVTQNVEVPVVYDPKTDYAPSAAATPRQRYRPLTYEDLAVPEASDPIIENQFNATVEMAHRSQLPPRKDRIAELERLFASKSFGNHTVAQLQNQDSVANAIPSTGKQWIYSREAAISAEAPRASETQQREPTGTAHFASTDRGGQDQGRQGAIQRGQGEKGHDQNRQAQDQLPPQDRSVLSPLPPPREGDASDPEAARQHHWIRQPE